MILRLSEMTKMKMEPSLYENQMVWPKRNDQNEMAPSLYEKPNGKTKQIDEQMLSRRT